MEMGDGSDSSAPSSDFSSDEDDALVAAAPAGQQEAAASVHIVEVDVVDESEESELNVGAASVAAILTDGARVMPACCLEAARPLLDVASVSLHYEQYMSGLSHLAEHWPAAEGDGDGEDAEEEGTTSMNDAAGCFRRVRAAIYAQFHRAFPLTWEMFAQWIDDVRLVGDKRQLFELAARDYWSVPLTLAHLRFLHGTPAYLHRHVVPGGLQRRLYSLTLL